MGITGSRPFALIRHHHSSSGGPSEPPRSNVSCEESRGRAAARRRGRGWRLEGGPPAGLQATDGPLRG
jgi:hypothetical protein